MPTRGDVPALFSLFIRQEEVNVNVLYEKRHIA